MANKITLTANDGSIVEFYDEIKAQGGVKDVYFSPDKTYVVAFYRKPINANDRERITNIVGIYHSKAKKKRGSGLLPLNCVTNSCLLTKKGIG